MLVGLFVVDFFTLDDRDFLKMTIKNVLTALIIAGFYPAVTRLREYIFNKVAKKYIKKDV